MRIEEMNAIRSAARETVVPTLVEAFEKKGMKITKIPHENTWYVELDMGENMPTHAKITLGIPTWTSTEKVPAFNLETAIAKAEADFAAKEEKKAANAAKRAERAANPKPARVDNTAYDAKVLEYLGAHEEPISAADLFAAHEWDEENKETKGKLISALSRLAKENKVENVKDKSKSYWKIV